MSEDYSVGDMETLSTVKLAQFEFEHRGGATVEKNGAHRYYSFSQSVFYFLSHLIATRKVPAGLQVKRVRSQPLVISSTASGGSTSAAATE